ncbi:helix-turn-helix transcriptional regulator [Arcicella sp. DC2W]|uniref:Helix-turn-helix transcriptional regulator n=1 Tax=Arcicella gelida TaxID=2984195 RepID=A0ABU5RZ13_9BACT|nr:helix-turn-helix transcriptional regulator [Arcicella sp. DC2W]MEA5401472.1 helix-turn-helix transcriptional regulator [Arcicella sp. DC2W]
MIIYDTPKFQIDYLEKEGISFNSFVNCNSADDFIGIIKDYRVHFDNVGGISKALWDNTNLTFAIPPDLQKWVDSFLNMPDWQKLNQLYVPPKLGFVISTDTASHLSVVDVFENSQTGFRPHFFVNKEEAVEWMFKSDNTPKPLPEPPEIKILHDVIPHKTRIELTIDSEDLSEYLFMLNKLLRSRKLTQKHTENYLKLTKREREILGLIIHGMTDKLIATHLCLSYETIRTHRKNIMTKLECKKASQLSIYAYFL